METQIAKKRIVAGEHVAQVHPAALSRHRFFVVCFVAITLTVSGSALLFALAVNPFGFVEDRLGSLASRKPDYDRNTRLSKIFSTARIRPDLVVLGSSRSDHGVDVRNPVVATRAVQPYNLSLDGTRIGEMEAYFDHALASGRLRGAIVGLDFHMFAVDPPVAVDNADLLDRPGRNAAFDRLLRATALSMTVDALRSSVATLRRQGEPEPYDPVHGQREDKYFRDRTRDVGGAGAYFRLWDEKEAAAYVNIARRRGTSDFAADKRQQFASFTRMMERARASGVGLTLFISPAHARNMSLIAATGQWEDFEAWKREIVRIVELQRAMAPNSWKVTLWDFSGYTSITTEPLPKSTDVGAQMQGYWDASHYKRAVGSQVLSLILASGRVAADRAAADGFGVELSSANIDSHLVSIRRAKAMYEREQPETIDEIAGMVRQAEAGRSAAGAR